MENACWSDMVGIDMPKISSAYNCKCRNLPEQNKNKECVNRSSETATINTPVRMICRVRCSYI